MDAAVAPRDALLDEKISEPPKQFQYRYDKKFPAIMIYVVHAHPYPRHSRACKALLAAVGDFPDLETRSLYDAYPDFDIDVAAEQAALARADLIVWLHPVYWYSVPALLKQWFEAVLQRGWAYGKDGSALRGKDCLWAAAAGGDDDAYSAEGMHAQPFDRFVPPIEQTARFCGMNWLPPFILQGAPQVSDADIATAAADFRARLEAWERNRIAGEAA